MFDTHGWATYTALFAKWQTTKLSCGEETMTMLSRFHRIPERDGQTDRIAISISRVSSGDV